MRLIDVYAQMLEDKTESAEYEYENWKRIVEGKSEGDFSTSLAREKAYYEGLKAAQDTLKFCLELEAIVNEGGGGLD